MQKISNVDEFITNAGFYRHDGSVVGPEDDFSLEHVLFDPDEAQVHWSRNPSHCIWTLTSNDDGDFLQSGVHFVNRLGYVFTQIAPRNERLSDLLFGNTVVLVWWKDIEEAA